MNYPITGRSVFENYVHKSRAEADKRRATKQLREEAKQLQMTLECSQVIIDSLLDNVAYKWRLR